MTSFYDETMEARGERYVRMRRSGTTFSITNPKPNMVFLRDIAYGLAGIYRFTGQTRLTVAEHALNVLKLLQGESVSLQAAALHHDDHEYIVHDVSSPVKAEIGSGGDYARDESPARAGDGYKRLAARIQETIHAHFGLPWPLPPFWRARIVEADRAALEWEAKEFLYGAAAPLPPAVVEEMFYWRAVDLARRTGVLWEL